MPDAPTVDTQDLANTEYDSQRRSRAAAGDRPAAPPPTSSDERPEAASPETEAEEAALGGASPGAGRDEPAGP